MGDVSKGIGIGVGIYLAIFVLSLAVPVLILFLLCGGCAAVFTVGGAAATNESRKADEAQPQQQPIAIVDEPPAFVDPLSEDMPPAPPPAIAEPEQPRAFGREFTDKTGKFRVRAEFVSFNVKNSGVLLRKEDGSEVEVNMRTLSDEDQEWIRAEQKRRAKAN